MPLPRPSRLFSYNHLLFSPTLALPDAPPGVGVPGMLEEYDVVLSKKEKLGLAARVPKTLPELLLPPKLGLSGRPAPPRPEFLPALRSPDITLCSNGLPVLVAVDAPKLERGLLDSGLPRSRDCERLKLPLRGVAFWYRGGVT